LQAHALDPIRLEINQRQRDDDMRLAVAKLQVGLVREGFEAMGRRVVENADPVAAAARAYLALDDDAREKTALFTSGHRLREELLTLVRAGLLGDGRLGEQELRIAVLASLNMSQEQLRRVASYVPGLVLTLHRDAPTIGLARGSYMVTETDPQAGVVGLKGDNGRSALFPRLCPPASRV
ncbi:MAG: hypothetical protein KGQ42_10005, partial [Alphaproteobacteria bacterium]|nr:hypothetical protein [Alphaproteobacteria bacterium]